MVKRLRRPVDRSGLEIEKAEIDKAGGQELRKNSRMQ